MFLIASEACLFRSYFRKNWPLLSPQHGFVTLGLAMILLGVNTLGNLNENATDVKNLGVAFWSVVISSGIIILVMGVVNIIASYVFRDSKLGITARNVRSSGAVAVQDAEAQLEAEKTLSIKSSMQSMSIHQSPFASSRSPAPSNSAQSHHAPSISSPPVFTPPSPKPTYSPTRTIFQQARASLLPSHFRTSRYTASNYSRSYFGGDDEKPPVPELPPYAVSEAGTTTAAPTLREKTRRHKKSSSKDSDKSEKGEKKHHRKRSSMGRFPINISSPLNSNPRFANLGNNDVKRPDLAHHPSQRSKDDNPYELPQDF